MPSSAAHTPPPLLFISLHAVGLLAGHASGRQEPPPPPADGSFSEVGRGVVCESPSSGFEIFRGALDAGACKARCFADASCASVTTYENSTCDPCIHFSTACNHTRKTTCAGTVVSSRRDGALPGPPYNLTAFERDLLPRWTAQFRVGDGPGDYSWLPVGSPAAGPPAVSLYGTTDLVYTLFFVGQLDELPDADKQAWAGVIQAFQDPVTGWFMPLPWENQNKKNWPWHPTHAAVETLALLGYAPRHAMAADIAILRNRSAWAPFMATNMAESTDVWGGSQQAQSLPGIARGAAPDESFAFYDWYFGWLNNRSDPASGYWPGKTVNPVKQLGGAFHIYHMYTCMGRAWPHAAAVVDATLALQDAETGMWRPQGGRATGLSYCIDLDGLYALTRSARLASGASGEPYRWGDVRAACARYLATAAAQLTHSDGVLGTYKKSYAQNTHLMHGALGAVAECQTFFPDLVVTTRPWRRAGGAAATRSCAYA